MTDEHAAGSDTRLSGGTDGPVDSTHEAILHATSDAVFVVDVEQAADGYDFTLTQHNAAYRENRRVPTTLVVG